MTGVNNSHCVTSYWGQNGELSDTGDRTGIPQTQGHLQLGTEWGDAPDPGTPPTGDRMGRCPRPGDTSNWGQSGEISQTQGHLLVGTEWGDISDPGTPPGGDRVGRYLRPRDTSWWGQSGETSDTRDRAGRYPTPRATQGHLRLLNTNSLV